MLVKHFLTIKSNFGKNIIFVQNTKTLFTSDSVGGRNNHYNSQTDGAFMLFEVFIRDHRFFEVITTITAMTELVRKIAHKIQIKRRLMNEIANILFVL